MEGYNTVSLPRHSTGFPEPTFLAEGQPMRIVQGNLATATLGPVRKMAYATVLTGELINYAAENVETIIQNAMIEASARALDAAVFSTAAATADRPAGLLNSVTPLAATAGGGLNAAVGDLRSLVGAINDAGGGDNVVVFANPRQAVSLSALVGPAFNLPVIFAPVLPSGTIVAIEPNAVASGFSGLPEVDLAKEATIHSEDTNPGPISTAGAPNVVSAPVRSMFQTDTVAVRLRLDCAWTMRGPGFIQVINGATF